MRLEFFVPGADLVPGAGPNPGPGPGPEGAYVI